MMENMNMSQFADSVSSGDEGAPPTLRKKIGGRQPGATNYSLEEVQCLLDLIRRMKPSNASQWDQLAVEYNKIQTFNPRTGENLNKKFQSLLKRKRNSDGTEMAPEVAMARSIHLQMRTANMGGGGDFHVDASDFSVDVESHGQPSNVALLVPDASTLQAVGSAVNNQQARSRPIVSSSSVTSTPSNLRNVGTNMVEVTGILHQLLEQNRNVVDSQTIINLLDSISSDVKLVLAELVQLNTLQNPNNNNALGSRRPREQDVDDARNKQQRHN